MRESYNARPTLDCTPILQVELNTSCRDEIIPILKALQHLYANPVVLMEILTLVGKDVNAATSPAKGRRGMDYWPIVVLAAVRLGCNWDYDKLQDMAEQHRALRQIMGIGNWDEEVCFDWRQIRDNICLLSPETIKKINQAIVAEGHRLMPKAPESVRGDSFVVETNIHYPTDSSLLGDGLRKIIPIAVALAALLGLEGWRQHQHSQKQVKALVGNVGRASRGKGGDKTERVKTAYVPLFELTEKLLRRARDVEQKAKAKSATDAKVQGLRTELQHYLELTEKVCGYSQRRVLQGETIPNSEKIFSIFEPHTELIRRGKATQENQFGHNVLIIEDSVGFTVDYQVMPNGQQDRDVVVPVMKDLQNRLNGKIRSGSFDTAFHSPENQKELAEIVRNPCVPIPGKEGAKQRQGVKFRKARQNHSGVESAIGALQAGNGLKRSRDRKKPGYERYVGLGILGRNLHVLGKILLAREDENSEAAKSKRKKCA